MLRERIHRIPLAAPSANTNRDRATGGDGGDEVVRIGTADDPSHELVVAHKHLYGRYEAWARQHNLDPCDAIAFRTKMEAKGFRKSGYRPNRATYWAGVTPKLSSKYRDRESGDTVHCVPIGYDPVRRCQLGVLVLNR